MKTVLAFFFALVFSATVLAQETECVEVEWGSDAMVELMKEYYIVRSSRAELRPMEFVGVGLEFLRERDELGARVVGVLPHGPAYQASVPLGGKVMTVDGVSTQSLNNEEMVEAIRGLGEEGTTVSLSIQLENGSLVIYTLTRAKIKTVKEVTILRMCKARFIDDSPQDK